MSLTIDFITNYFSHAKKFGFEISKNTFLDLNTGGSWNAQNFPGRDISFTLSFHNNFKDLITKVKDSICTDLDNDKNSIFKHWENEQSKFYSKLDYQPDKVIRIITINSLILFLLYFEEELILDEETPDIEKFRSLGILI